ncbi:hypothetical protein L9H26_02055 [Morganella psychrotolerans]|uniref:Lipoprotein n=1 Tax=Morganella psychrotolerans TaxID=368603 RepID=A0A5M9RCV7_9GAMM|nr:hypothetical protein [Morganella psychrotolerans]KAA8717808.1 hypothetical protein F4V73_08275 [Morganella psychrotolerans]
MMKRYFFLPVTILSMIVLSMIALTGCVAVSPPPPARLTGHVELQDFRYEQQTLVLTVSSAKKTGEAPVIQQRAGVSVLPYYFDFELPYFTPKDQPLKINVQLLRADHSAVEAEQEQHVVPGNAVNITLNRIPE